jgi:hypothetical protein
MNDEMERMWTKVVVVSSRYYPRTFLEGLTKTTNQDSHCPGRDSNWAHPEFKLELAHYLQYLFFSFFLPSFLPFFYFSFYIFKLVSSIHLTREWSDPTCRNLPWFFFHCKSTHNKTHCQNFSC